MNDIHDLLGAYCTDALDADDRAAFERHLGSCDHCRAEAADFREVLAALAAADPMQPPQALEDAVLDRARSQGSGQPVAAAEPSPPPAATAMPDQDSPADLPSKMPPRWRRAAPWMAAAAAGALLFAAGLGLGRSQVPAESAASGDAMAAVVAVASAEDAHVLPVDIMGTTSRVVMSQEMDKAVFLASELPMPAKGMCYQVWRVSEDGTMESAGVAIPAADGHIAVVLDGGAQDVTKFMITMEPPGGSDHPSGDMLAEVRT